MKVGSLVKRKPRSFGDWVDKNPWMITPKDLETGIIVRINRFQNDWNYEVLWQGEYTETHDETELLKVE